NSSATPDAQPSCKTSPRNARSSLHSASPRTVSISTRVSPAPTAPGPTSTRHWRRTPREHPGRPQTRPAPPLLPRRLPTDPHEGQEPEGHHVRTIEVTTGAV